MAENTNSIAKHGIFTSWFTKVELLIDLSITFYSNKDCIALEQKLDQNAQSRISCLKTSQCVSCHKGLDSHLAPSKLFFSQIEIDRKSLVQLVCITSTSSTM